MKPRLIHCYDKANALEIFKARGLPSPKFWDCPCGCNTSVAYARDSSALWLLSLATPVELGERVFLLGCETLTELRGYINAVEKAMKKNGTALNIRNEFISVIMAEWNAS